MSKFETAQWARLRPDIPCRCNTVVDATAPPTEHVWVARAYGATVEETEANAHLIAAAPDLYAVVKHLTDLLDGAWHFENMTITVSVKGNLAREARAALRRVEGTNK